MVQFTMTINDDEWERKEKLSPPITHRAIYLLGLETAENQRKIKTESDRDTIEKAAERCNYLNGGEME